MSWKQDALCSGKHVDIWFPPLFASERTGPESKYHLVAKAICYSCPVRENCLEAGAEEADGVWGGWTTKERKSGQHTPPPFVVPPQRVVYIPNGGTPDDRLDIKDVLRVAKNHSVPYEEA